MRVYKPYTFITHTGHRVRVAPGEYDSLPEGSEPEARRQGALDEPQPQVKAHAGAPRNKGRRRVSS